IRTMKGNGLVIIPMMLVAICVITFQYAYADNQITIPLGASHQSTGVFYSPSLIDIKVGSTITWKNDDTVAHTVSTGTPNLGIDGRIDSGIINSGKTFSYTFDNAGVYGYYCLIHPWMTGTVNVETDSPPQTPVTLSIYTDKADYHVGDNITVSGQASRFVPNEIVTVWVTDISGNGVASNHVSTETSDQFSTTIMPTNLWIPGKEYVVNAQYGARGTIATTNIQYESGNLEMPSWIKSSANQWSTGQLSDKSFSAGIQYMIKQGIVQSPKLYFVTDSNYHIPTWVKNTATWWVQGTVSDADFVSEIQYLITSGIIRVSP
ncbi:MAG: hypothetical protein KGL95_15750, partial [Patescibacteria group bacterium]|nr:hypothetical protein [Patescibacteria group bacterium]